LAKEAEEKRLAAEKAATDKARLEAAMEKADKSDPAYIAARKAFIEQATIERLNSLQRDAADAIQKETEEFNKSREAKYAEADERMNKIED
jgi:hypothetical protein